MAPSSSLLVNVVRPASKAGVANVTEGSGKRAATAEGTVGAGSGVTMTGDEGRTGVAIAGADGACSTLARAGGLAGGGAGRGAGAATLTGAGGRGDDAQALSNATASTVEMPTFARDRPNPAIRVSAAPGGADEVNIAAASAAMRDELCRPYRANGARAEARRARP